ncbi:MAG: DUF2924 domain-containing protein [Gammaproteobacteria bacterium]|nr:DUF2924 domain-containing protein [Gammaproteobacteria bacterium]
MTHQGWRLAEGAALDAALTALSRSSLDVLRRQWQRHFGRPAPRALRQEMLIRALAFERQAAQSGGLPRRVRRQLEAANSQVPASIAPVQPGTQLIRDWQGQAHHVIVLPEGFEYHGQRYQSLSEIARKITGTQWSGPRFFGLTSRAR